MRQTQQRPLVRPDDWVGLLAAVSVDRIRLSDTAPLEAASHADGHGHGCPSAPAMQHSGGAAMSVASTVSKRLSSKRKSSSLCGIARTTALGTKLRCEPHKRVVAPIVAMQPSARGERRHRNFAGARPIGVQALRRIRSSGAVDCPGSAVG